jgi:hypothetical protein
VDTTTGTGVIAAMFGLLLLLLMIAVFALGSGRRTQ